jgi:hypothetical protein
MLLRIFITRVKNIFTHKGTYFGTLTSCPLTQKGANASICPSKLSDQFLLGTKQCAMNVLNMDQGLSLGMFFNPKP